MKKALALAAAALCSTSLACPVKKGYIANGIVKNILSASDFVPLCEMNPTVKSQFFKTMTWTEVYGVGNDKKGALNIAYVQAGLKEKGYKQVATQKTSKGQIWRYDKGSRTVMLMVAVNDPLVFLAIGGR